MKSGIWFVTLMLLMALTMGGCENVSSEEDISVSSDGKFTTTDKNGIILDEDEDDWRIQSYFKNEFSFDKVLYPNPTSSAQITFSLYFSSSFPSNGFYVLSMNTKNQPVQLFQSTSVSFGTRTFTIPLSALSATNSPAELKGKQFRLRFYDAQSRLMTYGDIKLN